MGHNVLKIHCVCLEVGVHSFTIFLLFSVRCMNSVIILPYMGTTLVHMKINGNLENLGKFLNT